MTNPMDYYPGGTPHKLKDFIDTDKMRSKGMKWVGWDKEDYLIWITPDGMMHRFKELPRSDIGKKWERYNERKLTCLGDGSPRVPNLYRWKNENSAVLVKRDLYEAEFEACKSCALCIERDAVVSDGSTGSSVAGGDDSGGISIDDDPGDPTSYGAADYSTAGGGWGGGYGVGGADSNADGDDDAGTNGSGGGGTNGSGGGGANNSVTDPNAKANMLEKVALGMAWGGGGSWVDHYSGNKEDPQPKKKPGSMDWEDGLTIITIIYDRNGVPLPDGTRVRFYDLNSSNQIQENVRNLKNGYVVAGTRVVQQPVGGGKMVVETLEYHYPYNGEDEDLSDVWNGGEPKKLKDKLQLKSYSRKNIEPPKKDSFTPTPPRRPAYQPPKWQPMRPVTLPPPRIRLMQPYPPPRPPAPLPPPPPPPPPPVVSNQISFKENEAAFSKPTDANAEIAKIVATLTSRNDIVVEIQANSNFAGEASSGLTYEDENGSTIFKLFGGTVRGLMQSRANAVQNILIRTYGIPPDRIRVSPGKTRTNKNVIFNYIQR